MADFKADIDQFLEEVIQDDKIEPEGELWGIALDDYVFVDHQHNANESDALIEKQSIETAEKDKSIHDLRIVAKKLLILSIIVFIVCSVSLVIGLLINFYTWRGLTFNSMVIFASIIGIYLGIYLDSNTLKYKIFNLKLLLSYFILCCCFCIIIFGIQIVYLILIPIRIASYTEIYTIIMIIISYIIAIFFWIIFILFYIDIIARAVLRRGRIDWMINYLKSDRSRFCYIFQRVFNFRKIFRAVRINLTKITGIKFINFNVRFEHTSMENIFIEPGLVEEKNKISVDFRTQFEKCCDGMIYILWILLRILCLLIVGYFLFPLVVLCIIWTCVIYIGYWVFKKNEIKGFGLWIIVSVIGGIFLWGFLWFGLICSVSTVNSWGFGYAMNDYYFWSWQGQCALWNDVALWYAVRLALEVIILGIGDD
eukprot:274043_1